MTPLYGEYDEELLFEVAYRAVARDHRRATRPASLVRVRGPNAGGLWQILGQGTGP